MVGQMDAWFWFVIRHSSSAALSWLGQAQWPFTSAQAVGLYVSLPISAVNRRASYDRLLSALTGLEPSSIKNGNGPIPKHRY